MSLQKLFKRMSRLRGVGGLFKRIHEKIVRLRSKIPKEGNLVMSDDEYYKLRGEIDYLMEIEAIPIKKDGN